MDFNALQRKLFELDPSDPAEDLRKLRESAGAPSNVAPTKNYVTESVEVTPGSLGLDKDYSLSEFAALAGITLNESQKTGSAGQLKGKDAIKKLPAGTTKNATRDKLVGEDDDEVSNLGKTLSPNYTKNKADQFHKWLNTDSPTSKEKKPATKSVPGVNRDGWKGFLKQHTAQLHQIVANPKKRLEFDKFMARMGEGVEEASKSKPKPIKARDPSSQYMNDLRKSGAMGAHADKKRDAKIGKEKHKNKEYTTESIKQMLYRKLNESK
tara:strand:- start:13 stop:813 length:801 start_codon:yes stop_codon:yes gene_type:complete